VVDIFILFVAALIVSLGVVWIGHLFGPRRLTPRKAEPDQAHLTTPSALRRRTKFYRFVALFVLFQAGAVFLYPWAVLFLDVDERGFLFVDGLVFVLILCVGYAYAWKKGALEWD
jgi:NADH-quinone oxidoreductase subunit A